MHLPAAGRAADLDGLADFGQGERHMRKTTPVEKQPDHAFGFERSVELEDDGSGKARCADFADFGDEALPGQPFACLPCPSGEEEIVHALAAIGNVQWSQSRASEHIGFFGGDDKSECIGSGYFQGRVAGS